MNLIKKLFIACIMASNLLTFARYNLTGANMNLINQYTCKSPIYEKNEKQLFLVDYRVNEFKRIVDFFRLDASEKERNEALKTLEDNYEKAAFMSFRAFNYSNDETLRSYFFCLRQTAGFLLAVVRPVGDKIKDTQTSIGEQFRVFEQLAAKGSSEEKIRILQSLKNKYLAIDDFLQCHEVNDEKFKTKIKEDAESIKNFFKVHGFDINQQF